MQTTSPELSKKLEELGINQKSHFWWCFGVSNCSKTAYIATENEIMASDGLTCKPQFKAYTLDEILEMLPSTINYEHEKICLIVDKNHVLDLYVFGYDYKYNPYYIDRMVCNFRNKNPAEAAGQLLVWCIENGHVKIGDHDVKN